MVCCGMKITIYLTSSGNYHVFPGLDHLSKQKAPVKAYLIHTKIVRDFNSVTFSSKKSTSNKSKSVLIRCFIPRADLSSMEQMKMEAEIKRGKAFFSLKEGFLPGAMIELPKYGEFVAIQN